MRRAPILLAAALALLLAACGRTSGPAQDTSVPEESVPLESASPAPTETAEGTDAPESPAPTESGDPETAEPVWTDQVFAEDITAADGTVVMSVDYVFPAIEDAGSVPAWQKISDYYTQEGKAYMDTARELAGYAEGDYEVAQVMGEDFLPYGESHSYRIAYQGGGVVSIVRSYYANSVTGAAHPANYQFSEQFDLETGDALTLSTFFSDFTTAREEILDLLAQKAAGAGYTREDLAGQFNESYFYLTEEGFVFYYQPDTLAPYAAGLLEFSIPYGELEDLLARPVWEGTAS